MSERKPMIGIYEPKPARGFPAGRVRWIMRNDQYLKAAVRAADGVRIFIVADAGDAWEPLEGCEQASKRTAQLAAVWIPVGDELPDDEIEVLVADVHGEVSLGFHVAGEWLYSTSPGGEVTHWMDVPAPPEEVNRVGSESKEGSPSFDASAHHPAL